MAFVDSGRILGAADLQALDGNAYPVIRGTFVLLSNKRGALCFQWTDAGRHGAALLRRCVFLQHVEAYRSGGSGGQGSGQAQSGAASCAALLRAQGPVNKGCLADAASLFLATAWSELRQVVLQELQLYARAMRPLEEAAAKEGALLAAMAHMRCRCHLWMALHRAPSDLLGDLNEARTEPLARDALAALRRALLVLLESGRAGLAAVGEQLQAAVRQEGSSQMSDEACASWLLTWRLYLEVHRVMEVFTLAYRLQLGAPTLLQQPSPLPGRLNAPAAALRPDPGVQVAGSGWGQAPVPVVVSPLELLTLFTAMWAARATDLVRPNVRGPAEVVAASQLADQRAAELGRQLRPLGLRLLRLLRVALEEQEEEDPQAALRQQLQPPPAAAGAVARGLPPAAGQGAGTPPAPTSGSLPYVGAGARGDGARAPAAMARAQSTSSMGSASSSGGGPDSLLGMVDTLAAVVPRRRFARLFEAPGQVALMHHLVMSTRSVLDAVAPGPEASSGTARDGSLPTHTRGAVLALATCTFLHQLHGQLAGLHCASTVAGSADQLAAYRPLQDWELAGDEDSSTPDVALTQLHLDAASQRLEGAVAAAGAASLAARGIRPDSGRAAEAHTAAALAELLVRRARAAAGSATHHGGQQKAGPPLPLVVLHCRDSPDALDKDSERVVQRAITWARHVDTRAQELWAVLAAEADDTGAATTSSSCAAPAAPGPQTLPCDGEALMHAALLMAAGRLCLLASAAGWSASARPPGHVTRWTNPASGSTAPPGGQQQQQQHKQQQQQQQPRQPPTALLALSVMAPSGQQPLAAAPEQPAAPSSVWRLSTPASRRSVVHMAAASVAAATNRVAQVLRMHCPGPGADLKALCLAHSDAVTLAAAAEQLAAALQAIYVCAWGAQLGAAWGQRGKGRRPLAAKLGVGPPEALSAGGKKADGSAPSVMPTQSRTEGSQTAGRVPPARRSKPAWRRSLGRIMPAFATERTNKVAEEGPAANRAIATTAGTQKETSGRQPPDGPHPKASRGCWASDPVEPAKLPPPAPLCSFPTQEVTQDGLAPSPTAAATAAVGAPPAPRAAGTLLPPLASFKARQGYASASPDSSCRSGVAGAGAAALPPAMLALLRAARVEPSPQEPSAPEDAAWPTVLLGAAEAGTLRVLASLTSELRRISVRAAELLGTEMSSRIAAVYRAERTGEAAAPGKSRGGPIGSATQQVVASLLQPLREALAGLHPASQAQLLCRSYSAVMLVLRQLVRRSLGVGPDGGGAGAGRRGAERRVVTSGAQQARVRELDADMAVLEGEVGAAWAQVDREAAVRGTGVEGGDVPGGGGAGGSAAGQAASSGVPQEWMLARSDIGIQVRSLRAELATCSGPS